MKDVGRTRALLRAAREDRPGSARTARIWEGVSLAPQLSLVAAVGHASVSQGALAASGGAKTFAAGAIGALSAGKLILAGAIVGSALTVGLGAFVLRGSPSKTEATRPSGRAQVGLPEDEIDRAQVEAYAPDVPASIPRPWGEVGGPHATAAEATSPVPAPRFIAPTAPSGDLYGSNALTREVTLVGEARRALASGRASAALTALDAAARSGSRSLEPEALVLRSRALRALGRDEEAARAEATLRSRYPGSFLAR